MSLATPVNAFEYYNRNALRTKQLDGFLGVRVNTRKAQWQGKKYKELTSREKRRWENMLVMSFPKDRLKIAYHDYA